MPVGSRSNLRPAVRPKIVKKKTNKFVRFHADLFKRMAVRHLPHPPFTFLLSSVNAARWNVLNERPCTEDNKMWEIQKNYCIISFQYLVVLHTISALARSGSSCAALKPDVPAAASANVADALHMCLQNVENLPDALNELGHSGTMRTMWASARGAGM